MMQFTFKTKIKKRVQIFTLKIYLKFYHWMWYLVIIRKKFNFEMANELQELIVSCGRYLVGFP